MNIFLTGASGFLGKNFYKFALKKGHFIYAPSRKKRKNKKNLKWLYGKYSFEWKKEILNSDILVHMASSGLNADDLDIYDSNVFESLDLLKNCIKYRLKKWLIVSTSSEYGLRINIKEKKFSVKTNRIPNDDYGLSKAIFSDQSIRMAKIFGCKARIMRVFPVYGIGENKNRLFPSLITAAKLSKNFYLKNPFEKRNFINVKSVTNILYDAMNFDKKKFNTSQIWHVSENKPLTTLEFAQNYWNIYKAKGKLKFDKKSKKKFNHLTDYASLWKI